jgi:hypothetical protein
MKTISSFFILLVVTFQVYGQNSRKVFNDDFESATIKQMLLKWDDSENSEGMSFSLDVPAASKGKQSLMMTYKPCLDNGGYLYKMLPEGYDTLYARFYIKFVTNYSKVHHLVSMGGYNPPSKWSIGRAGIKPKGNDRFNSSIEPIGENGTWDFYTYWMNMHGYADPDHFWGNSFTPDPQKKVETDKWMCIEFMILMNNPVSSSNGEQAFWVNGEKISHLRKGFPNGYWKWDRFIPSPDSNAFEGFRWRSTKDLKLNFFKLSYYMTDGKQGETDSVLFDDVVISTCYIGPTEP